MVDTLGHLAGKTFIFYYLWYGNPEHNGQWQHWDHEVLPHWTEAENQRYPRIGSRHSPPDFLHSPYYPQRGPYSSTDDALLDEHMAEIKGLGNDPVVVLSWWGQASREGTSDTQGVQTDHRVAAALAAAARAKVSVAWHLEPYPGRTAASVVEDTYYIQAKYGCDTCGEGARAILRVPERGGEGKEHMVFFVYDSYHVPPGDWSAVLNVGNDRKDTPPGVFIALWLEDHHLDDIVRGGFHGFYTYFASSAFVWGSTPTHWGAMVADARNRGLLSVLSVGPGYVDHNIRPWNTHNSRHRAHGHYYNDMWQKAMDANPDAMSVTSYNEWGEGTQIEPARNNQYDEHGHVKRDPSGAEYTDYHDEGGPNAYLEMTKKWIGEFSKHHRELRFLNPPEGHGHTKHGKPPKEPYRQRYRRKDPGHYDEEL